MLPPLSTRRRRAWLAAAMFAAAAVPTAAQCAIDTAGLAASNVKAASFLADICRKTPAVASSPMLEATPAAAPQRPSALERMRMSQEGSSAEPAKAPEADAPAAPMAAYPANFRSGPEPVCAATAIEQSYDSDSELGTAAIAIDHTRFDDRWDRVRRAAPGRQMRVELQMAGARRGLAETDLFELVNRWVNHRVTYISDDRNYGQGDVWATASETIARGSGDCEDFAILKMQMLRAAGIGDDRVKLVLLRDLALGADHALLLVRTEAGWVALDNMTDRVYDGSRPMAVRPIMSFSGKRRFVHGYLDPQLARRPSGIALDSRPLAPAAANDSSARAARIAYKATRYGKEQDDLLASGAILALISWPLGGRN